MINSAVSQYWFDFYTEYGLKVPQAQSGSHPNNLSLDDKFTYKVFLKWCLIIVYNFSSLT